MATGVPQYHRPVAGGPLAAAVPALLPEPDDDRPPTGRTRRAGGGAVRPAGGAALAGGAGAFANGPGAPPGGPGTRTGQSGTRSGEGEGEQEPDMVLAAYDTVTVALRHGLETVDILRLRRACGSVLQGRNGSTVSFLVPAGTADTWHLPGTSCTAGAHLLPATDPRWVMPPAGAGCTPRPTDAWVLRSALCEAACTLTAGGLGPF